jgi:uncharacterized protein YijF (DUF1287 family)
MDGEIWRGCVSIESNIHIGIVVDRQTIPSGRNKIVHNIGLGQNLADCLFDWDIIGHYRYDE